MDIVDLQQRLRAFAQARDWEPYLTPKNLAMALVVEAAELVEIFQWKTAEESMSLDAATQEHLGEEISDVLMYLLQIADRSGVDVARAVERKLGLNAVKYPAPPAASPASAPSA
ncbi:nucleotide pyrophosphohydrolase [Roseateles sp. SL47]|uniref:nucleotide pyrophosphohydrolase n=1 Tax=Roseateles sp. SL47 TaxID=2995138 RepID=UPI00226EE36B|nr:nucleotide pyrophosphohydrolase [Roseateles sp. SL47]WAC74082.1 nucleotide pyrophosphohydrolase [Roseateles sp. SL47]